jgi:hypothetical protein
LQVFEERGIWDGVPVLLQRPAEGRQAAVRAVFCHGTMVGIHMNALLVRGIGGAATSREACSHPIVIDHMRRLGQHLNWHGPLFAEYFYDERTQTPAYIEADPRIGDVANATLSGVNLCQQWIDVAMQRSGGALSPYATGFRSHAGLLMLMTRAIHDATRRELLSELWRQWRGTGVYQGSEDELTRPHDDWLSVIPYAWVTGRILARPAVANQFVRQTVRRYALSQEAAERIRRIPLEQLTACLAG